MFSLGCASSHWLQAEVVTLHLQKEGLLKDPAVFECNLTLADGAVCVQSTCCQRIVSVMVALSREAALLQASQWDTVNYLPLFSKGRAGGIRVW